MFGPERKAWVRKLDAFFILLMPLGLAGWLFFSPNTIEAPLLNGAFYGSLACTPIVAWAMYRETRLSRLERIALLGLVLCLGLALMVAIIEAGRQP